MNKNSKRRVRAEHRLHKQEGFAKPVYKRKRQPFPPGNNRVTYGP